MQPIDPMQRSTMNVPPSFASPPSRNGGRMWRPVIFVIIVLALLWAAMYAKGAGWLPFLTGADDPNPKLYQAVFLGNQQVYFGKIKKMTRGSIVLTDIFYLQVVQEPLQGNDANGQQPAADSKEPAINLVKIGSEIHGPTDKMVIPKTSVVFWEDIKADGTVAKAIAEFKAKKASE